MSTKIFLGVIVVVLIVAGYVIYRNYENPGAVALRGPEVSFMCEDGTSFIAQFSPEMDQMNVIVAGNIEYTLPNTGNEMSPYSFGDSERQYAFAGEGVTVAHAYGAGTVCTQPFDANNAPYNFGDAGTANLPDIAGVVNESIKGTWVSIDDESFVREFRDNGELIDSYAGEAEAPGTWEVFTNTAGVETTFPQEPNVFYLEIKTGTSTADILHFTIAKVTPEDLELIYMARGNILRFTKSEVAE